MMNTQGHDTGIENEKMTLSLPDRWIISRLQQTIVAAETALKQYRFDLFAQTLYDFTWNEFCDWYLELSKPILTSGDSCDDMLRGTRHTLVNVLEALLRLIHPIMPFITEDIWQRLAPLAGKNGSTIMLEPYPIADNRQIDASAVKELEWIKNVIVSIRTIRSEMNIAPGKLLTVLFRKGTASDKNNFEQHKHLLLNLARLESITWLNATDAPPESATAIVGDLEIFIPLAGLINREEENARLSREIAKVQKDLQLIEGMMGCIKRNNASRTFTNV